MVIKPYLNRVSLVGYVKYPAIYEIKDTETIADLLNISGGFTNQAFKNSLTIDRFGSDQKEVSTILKDDFDAASLVDGDSIYVTKIPDKYLNRVKIEGAIKREGYYELTDTLTLFDLIDIAGGLREDAYLKRGNIIRLTSDLRLTNLTFDVKEVIELVI